MSTFAAAEPKASTSHNVSLYRAIWRWHFFAGLLVIPFMLNLAITGSLYLFKDQIADTFYAHRNIVADTGSMLTPQQIVDAAVAAVPGSEPASYREAPSGNRSAVVTVSKDGQSTIVYVNPHNGEVLASIGSKQEFNWVVKRIHSLEYFGKWTNRIVEIVGGFALMLVVTGIYLWWPRQQRGGVLSVRGTPSRRVFWRDLHAVTGAITGIGIFFLAFSGMPWSGYWGANVNAWLTAHDLGTPAALWDSVPKSAKVTQDIVSPAGWVVENAPVPLSDIAAAQAAKPIDLNKAVEIMHGLGMALGSDLAIPTDETGVYTASHYLGNLGNERTVHIDQYSGKPLVDLSFAQYPALGQAIEWGINVHQGQEWGLFNQLLMLATCMAIILSCVTAIAMWWKRRPAGRLGVPPMPPQKCVYVGLWLIVIVFGAAFPLTGLAVVVMLLFDQIVVRLVPPLRRFFS
ncbi:PepSY-associated TM helix domain-containing protein [Rhizobium sp. LEGMi198b]|uniref:PepSY-associated TM helix domain-containing protein n=1 Tax=Rhizobium sp. CNPSo 3464 TaxID=3021406 RepID=UPI002549DACA|nr:PepSY domain-containing protein [Rhizobium sp. CNPSo 3464]MDK4739887.1 PepSY domain-containing protein [Rhizobium sp. CNPSo 3464]